MVRPVGRRGVRPPVCRERRALVAGCGWSWVKVMGGLGRRSTAYLARRVVWVPVMVDLEVPCCGEQATMSDHALEVT